MTLFVRGLLVGVAFILIAFAAGHVRSRINTLEPPHETAEQWALAALDAARNREPRPEPPPAADYRAAGPIFVTAWASGGVVARHVGGENLIQAVDEAASAFDDHAALTSHLGWRSRSDEARVRFTIEVTLGDGPIDLGIPFVTELSLVPRHEGMWATFEGRHAYVSPQELLARRAFDGGVTTPIPDLKFGVDVKGLVGRLARDLGVETHELVANGSVRRIRCATLSESEYPRSVEVSESALREASTEAAAFLLRHQQVSGAYTYIYDAARGRDQPQPYNIPRHSGTTYFLAQVDRYHGMPAARQGAIRALQWLRRRHVRRCGDHPCVHADGRSDVGSAALTVVAATEVLMKEDHPVARELVEGLSGFLRSLQREDGELMHEFDIAKQEPIDVQHLYYSGEAAFALFKAYEAAGDQRNLDAALGVMKHLTGAGWNFLGSRYYYGEEHWTCIAAGQARAYLEGADLERAIDFCSRWYGFNNQVQYRAGETPWESSGAYGVGPVLVPRLTPVGSRTEAFVSTYQLLTHHNRPAPELRGVVERGLGQLLRWRFAPGPTHLFANPVAAHGGVPGSPVDLMVRNDFVQHAGSAMIRWADVLRSENQPSSP